MDCLHLGRFKTNQSRLKTSSIKLKRIMGVSAILANKRSLPFPLVVKPDMSSDERKIELTLPKECWSLIQGG